MVRIIRAAMGYTAIPAGFPILVSERMAIIEPAFAWLMELATIPGRSHAAETVRTYGEDLARAYGIHWVEDLFAPADEDSRYTTDVEAFLGAQHEWMASNLPKKGIIAEATNYGEVKLPPKAERVYGKPAKSDCTAMYLDREGRVQTVHYRMPEAKKPKGKKAGGSENAPENDVGVVSKPRPDVTRKGVEMIGDYRS